MGQKTTLTAADGFTFGAYRAEPAGQPKGAIVVIQEIFGVNSHIRNVADGFAAQGYAAIAPALFDRARKDVELGYEQADIQEGITLRGQIDLNATLADVQAAIDAVKGASKVGIVGYCWGGSLAFLAATRLKGLSAAVGYYGGMIAQHAAEMPRVPTILHFGERDHGIPLSDVEKVQKAHPDMAIFVYPADHGFNCDQRGSYDAPSAKLALDRTLEFFGDKLAA